MAGGHKESTAITKPEPAPPLADRPVTAAVVALAGALPTLVLAFWEPSLLVDDWGFASSARATGLSDALHGSDVRSRPLQAAYHGLTFLVLGDHPTLHLLLLAALNGAAAYLLLRACRTRLSGRSSLLIALIWAALANHGATRLWISTGPTTAALVLLLAAACFALRREPRLVVATVLVVLSALFYEGGIVIGLGLVLFAAWNGPPERRVVRMASVAAVVAATAASVYVSSPKLIGGATATGSAGDAVPALLGSALLPDFARDASVLPLLAIILAAASAIIPEFRRSESVRLLAVGALVAVAGIAPFLAVHFPLATDGMLDRANTFATVGVAILLAGTLDQLWRLRPPAAVVLSAAFVVVLAAANVTDVRDAHLAGRDGEAVLDALARLDPPADVPIVLAPMPNHGGYSAFGYGSLAPAVLVRSGRTLSISDTLTERELASLPGTKYRFENGQLVPVHAGP